jgi:hypothetical protein
MPDRTRLRVDGRGVSRGSEDVYGRIEPVNKSAPGGASTPETEGLAETYRGGSTVNNGIHNPTIERQRIAIELLHRASDDLVQATVTRIRYISLARDYGLTWRDIATAVGLTETGARTLFERNRELVGEG